MRPSLHCLFYQCFDGEGEVLDPNKTVWAWRCPFNPHYFACLEFQVHNRIEEARSNIAPQVLIYKLIQVKGVLKKHAR